MTDFPRLLQCLITGQVEFIIIGGFAATAHGSAHVTVDLDVVYRRTSENMRRLAQALEPLSPRLRGAPPGLPFRFDVATIEISPTGSRRRWGRVWFGRRTTQLLHTVSQ